MNPVEKSNIKALAEAIKSAENPQDENEIGGQTAADLINAYFTLFAGLMSIRVKRVLINLRR